MLTTKISPTDFTNYFPQYETVKAKLNELDVTYAIFAGSEVWLLTNSRVPTDLDILVRDEDLQKVADAFGQEVKTKQKSGVSADYILIDNVELVSNIIIEKGNRTIHISLDEQVTEHLATLELGDGQTLPLLAPEDTLIIKALLRRGESEGKFDLEDINAVKSLVELDEGYLRLRSSTLGVDGLVDVLFTDRNPIR